MDFSIAHQDLIDVTRSGFAFLIANGAGWLIVGLLAFKWPEKRIATILLFLGLFTMPLAFGLRSILGLPDYNPENPLNQLGLLLAFSPAVAFPAIIISYFKFPAYLPCVMAAILGGHFLPYAWLYQTNIYLIIGIAVAIVPGLLIIYFEKHGFALGPLFVGITLITGSFFL